MNKKLVVCGGGSSSHTLIPFLKDSIFDVYVYTSRPEKWANTIQLEWHDPSGKVLGTYSGNIKKASNDPNELFPEADYVVFCMPVHKYRVALHEIAPYLNKEKDVFLGTLVVLSNMVRSVLHTVAKPLIMPLVFQSVISSKLMKNFWNKYAIDGSEKVKLSRLITFCP